MLDPIHAIVRKAEDNYVDSTVRIGDHVDFSMHETIERIIAYLNSKHISGDQDSLGREKPFFNIVIAIVNIWYRATDVSRKDIIIRPDKVSNTIPTLFATALLQDWMRREEFGTFLNQWGRVLAQFGSAVVKFVKRDGRLVPSVIPWNRMICDQMDFYAQPRIERLYRTPAQLRKESLFDQKAVEALISSIGTRKSLGGDSKDLKDEFIELYEVHDDLPIAYLKDDLLTASEHEEKTYTQQIHVLSFVKNKDGKYDDFTLYKGREERDPYVLTHLIEEEGRTLSIGAVEASFDAQWMQNHTQKNLKDTLDLSSKLIFQTADQNFIGRNVLSSIETGDIMVHAANSPLTQINTGKADITALQNFSSQWRVLSQEITATPEAARGITPPSGTPYSTTAALLDQSNSLFKIMTENKGLALEKMLREFIIPYLKTKMDNQDEVLALMRDLDLKKLDAMYIPNEAVRRYNARAAEDIIGRREPLPFDERQMQSQIRQELSVLGNQRFLSPGEVNWKEALKDLEWEVEVGVTNEPSDKQALLQTLSTVLQTLATNPNILQDPNAKLLFTRVLNYAGVMSPAEITDVVPQPQPEEEVPTQ